MVLLACYLLIGIGDHYDENESFFIFYDIRFFLNKKYPTLLLISPRICAQSSTIIFRLIFA